MTLENILADFQLLDDWEDRYRYVIELGRALPPLPEAARTEANRVRGCASQVWLATKVNGTTDGPAPRLMFKGDSDAHIVRGLIAILFAIYSGRCAAQAALASLLMTRRASVQIRSTIEANPFERCGVKCSANSRRRNTPSASIRTISSAHRPE